MKLSPEKMRRALRITQLILDQLEKRELSSPNPFVLIPGKIMRQEGYRVDTPFNSDDFDFYSEVQTVHNELLEIVEVINYLSGSEIIKEFKLIDESAKNPDYTESALAEMERFNISVGDIRNNFTLKLIPKVFSAITKLEAVESKINDLPVRKALTQPDIQQVLFLDPSGNLWREPKEKYCYPMMEAKERLALVKFLAKHQGGKYIKTPVIASALRKNAQYVRSEAGKINIASQKNLKLKLIDSKQASGYRINPALKLKMLTR